MYMKKIAGFVGCALQAHGRLQLHGSPVASDCCNRFQKRCWQMGWDF